MKDLDEYILEHLQRHGPSTSKEIVDTLLQEDLLSKRMKALVAPQLVGARLKKVAKPVAVKRFPMKRKYNVYALKEAYG
jgi:hypothetical protein